MKLDNSKFFLKEVNKTNRSSSNTNVNGTIVGEKGISVFNEFKELYQKIYSKDQNENYDELLSHYEYNITCRLLGKKNPCTIVVKTNFNIFYE